MIMLLEPTFYQSEIYIYRFLFQNLCNSICERGLVSMAKTQLIKTFVLKKLRASHLVDGKS